MAKKLPASIRNKNPGAMGLGSPTSSARRFGATSAEKLNDGLGQNNEAATFPSHVKGAAALFDLLTRHYTGRPLDVLLDKYANGNEIPSYLADMKRLAGVGPDFVLTRDYMANPATAIPFAKAIAWHEAGRQYPMTDAQWREAHALAFAPVAERVASGVHPMVRRARNFIGLREVPGRGSNLTILDLWKDASRPDIRNDAMAWCSGFVGGVAGPLGYEIPKPGDIPMARSWLRVGIEVAPEDVQPGDVRVEERGAAPYGHVQIVAEVHGDEIETVEGNVGNAVVSRRVPLRKTLKGEKVLGYRRLVKRGEAKPATQTISESPSLRMQLNNMLAALVAAFTTLMSTAQSSGVALPVTVGLVAVIVISGSVFFRQLSEKRVAK